MRLLRILFLLLLSLSTANAESKTIDLHVSYKTVQFAGRDIQAIAVNNQIPGPILHFKEGDEVTINVHNDLEEGTTIHWHGLLVPWRMDGVEGVNQDPIPPGDVFSYQFKLQQSGTYWYHAHKGLQEQQGLYGAIIIDPIKPPSYHYTQDEVIVLSDWSNTNPDQIFSNLKKTGEFYSPNFPLQPSLARFIKDYEEASSEGREKLLKAYTTMQEMRMSVYDISDVAYDAFLLNGRPNCSPWIRLVNIGDVVRLRFIGAGASAIFRVKIPGASLQIVHIQGHDVVPYEVEDFTIAPGETTDVLIKIEKNSPYIIYAESTDTVGAAYGALITKPEQDVDYESVEPFPIPEPLMGHQGGEHASMTTSHTSSMDMGSHEHSTEDSHPSPLTMGTKYQDIKSPIKTNDPSKPYTEIKMELSGWMDRFMWFINGLPEFEAEPILIEPGKRYRLVFTNTTMMHHPMHLHGHFMILRNGHEEYDPFLHTIDVPPGTRVVADFDADASGQWFFHCHNLYHMVAGMSRVFRYATFMKDFEESQSTQELSECSSNKVPDFVKRPLGHGPHFGQASFIDLGYDPFHNVQKGNLDILIGEDKNKLQLYSEDAEIRKGKVESADLDIFYWHLISQFWAIKGGANYFYKPSKRPYWQPGVGIEGTMPYFIDTNLRTYLHQGSVKFDLQLSRSTQLYHSFFLMGGLRGIMATHAVPKDEIGRGLNYIEYIVRPYYTLTPNVSLFIEYDFTQDYGNLKKILRKQKQDTKENVLMFGVSLLL